jgi:ApbE superfamily uncharacterized protein (UPF0280 family)
MKEPGYKPRFYRFWSKDTDLVSFNVVVKETDLYIRARRNLRKKALDVVLKQRALLEGYIDRHPGFVTALVPFPVGVDAPQIVREMADASLKVGVGPMAAVAGAIAEAVGRELLNYSSEVIVENGGDIFLRHKKPRHIGIYAGDSPLSGKLALEIKPEDTPLGVCTSSGTVGHSLSFGKADAAIVLSPSAALADAAATAVGNLVKTTEDMPRAIEFVREVEGLMGIAIIVGDKMAVWGKINLVRRESST